MNEPENVIEPKFVMEIKLVKKSIRKRRNLVDFVREKEAADNGNPEAMFHLYGFYVFGEFTTQDVRHAESLVLKSAEKGYAPAQTLVGFKYQHGIGRELDIEKAENFYHLAANQGDIEAARLLGLILRKKKPQESKHWIRLAADLGDPEAQLHLGNLIFSEGGQSNKRIPQVAIIATVTWGT